MSRTFGTTNPQETKMELAHRALARRAAAESFVLLRNEHRILPLAPGRIALYGIGARRTVKGGLGSGSVSERYSVTIEQGLVHAGFTVTTTRWLNDFDHTYEKAYQAWHDMVEGKVAGLTDPTKIIPLAHSYVFPYPTSRPVTEEDIEESDTDTCLYVLTRQAGEGLDRKPEKGDFYLTDAEEQDIALLARRYPKFILAVNVGGLVDFSFLDAIPGIDAIVLFVQGGEEGGNALADVLTGKRNFSGHLADTIPLSYADVPSARTFSDLDGDDQNDTYHEGIYVGYRYYDTFGKSVRFPFGFGLSYTTFSESCTGFSQIGDAVTVRVRVKNTGAVSGRQVIQLYLLLPQTEFRSETKRLAAFDKTKDLAPGEEEERKLSFRLSDAAVYDEARSAFVLQRGTYVLCLGEDSRHLTPAAAFFLREHHIVLQCRSCCAPTEKIEELCPPKTSPLSLPEDIPLLPIREEEIPARTVRYEEPTVKESRADKAFLDSLTDKELVRLVIGGNLMQADPGSFEITGAGGKTPTCFAKKGLQNLCFSDGPAGINIAERVYLLPGGKEAPAAVPERYQWGILAHSLDRLKDQNLPIVYREATAWPVEALLAQSWDPGLLEEIGDATGEEMEAFGISVWLAPAMNLHRNPLGGRTFEYYSEDPLISGKLAAAITRGVQRRDGKFVCLKHFACNNGENNRNGISENVSERALRELYLKGFAIAVREGQPGTLMTSYNMLNHTYTANRHDLVCDILRCEWGYEGLVMTDWSSTNEKAADPAACMLAQNDLIMPGTPFDRSALEKAVTEGRLKRAQILPCALRVLHLVEQGLPALDAAGEEEAEAGDGRKA